MISPELASCASVCRARNEDLKGALLQRKASKFRFQNPPAEDTEGAKSKPTAAAKRKRKRAIKFPRRPWCAVCEGRGDKERQPVVTYLCGYTVCEACAELPFYRVLTATAAKKEYALKAGDLDDLGGYHYVSNAHGRSQECSLYWTFHLQEKADLVHGGRQGHRKLLEKNASRAEKAAATRKRHREEELEERTKRRRILEEALAARNLPLRSDSSLCSQFITDGGNVGTVVEAMAEMSWFFAHTTYGDLSRDERNERREWNREERRGYGHRDDDFLGEMEAAREASHDIKTRILRRLLKSSPASSSTACPIRTFEDWLQALPGPPPSFVVARLTELRKTQCGEK